MADSKKPLYPNIEAERARNNETDMDVARVLGMSRQSYQSRKYGQSKFYKDEIDVLCEHFGKSYEYLFSEAPQKEV